MFWQRSASTMERSPPPLFRQEPSAFARLVVFVTLAFALLICDARYQTLEALRQALGTGLYPLQQAVLIPRERARSVLAFFASLAVLHAENQTLKARNLELAQQVLHTTQLSTENAHLRALLQLKQHEAVNAVPAEVQYEIRNPFIQKVIIDRGLRHGVQIGAPVIDEKGVIGQVRRVYLLQAEVALLTDQEQAVPVQSVRTGIRSVIYGTPHGSLLELRFIPVSADIKSGDEWQTSGLDGLFPPGLPVAKVLRVERRLGAEFAHVICAPVTPVRRARQLLVLHYKNSKRRDNAITADALSGVPSRYAQAASISSVLDAHSRLSSSVKLETLQ